MTACDKTAPAKNPSPLFISRDAPALLPIAVCIGKRARRRRARFQLAQNHSVKVKVMSVYFGGSRSLSSSPIIGQVVASVLASGSLVHVGCSAGADALVIGAVRSSLFSQFSQLRVFCAFSQSGAGAWSGSAVQVVQAFARAGGSVSWLAGGSLAVPLAGRLISRSVAGLRGSSAAVFFSPGSGSLAVAGHAVRFGIPCFAFGSCPVSGPAGCAGSWVASSFHGFTCWAWQSAQLSLF